MKQLTLEETALKEEMKERCLAKGQYVDENAKKKFDMLCHLEDFEVQYWELQKENKILKENAENNDKVVDKVNWENQLLKKENQELKEQLEEYQLQNIDLRADIMIQKKAFPNKLIKDKTFYDLYNMPTYEDLLHQQKEFTSYLEKIIEELECDDVDDEEMKGYLIQRIDTFKEILRKYKSIIGDGK